MLSFAQINSVTSDVHFETEVGESDSASVINVLHVDATIDDIDFMGEILTTVYDAVSNYPVMLIKMTKQEYTDSNDISEDIVTTRIYGLSPENSYRIETVVRNFQGANFPVVITNYNPN